MRALRSTLFVALAACAPAPPPPNSADNFDRSTAHWEDAFDRVPEVLLLVRPQALRRDATYGPLLKTVSKLAAARSPAGTGARAVEAFESADEVIVGIRERARDDVLVVLRGVRPDIDPEKLADERGLALWHPAKERARVPELVQGASASASASLFVLPQRTWVVAIGEARARAREAFANPFGRPPPTRDDHALILVRLDGDGLVQWVPRLRARGGPLEAIGRKLNWVTFALHPGGEGVLATFAYADEDAAAWAESTVKQVVEAYGRGTNPRLAWLSTAKLERENRVLKVRVALPARLIEELPNAQPAELGF